MAYITPLRLLLLLSILPTLAYAEKLENNSQKKHFIIEHAELITHTSGIRHILNADIRLTFNQEIITALEHGITLQIDTEIKIKQRRHWLWDKTVYTTVVAQKLQYHPLSNQYLVTRQNLGSKHDFQNLHQALKFIGTIRDQPIKIPDTLQQEGTTAQIRTQLNTDNLPSPLKLATYIHAAWNLSSPWHECHYKNANEME